VPGDCGVGGGVQEGVGKGRHCRLLCGVIGVIYEKGEGGREGAATACACGR
jgi:hypothetical protein